jgi:Rieske Fe-S protein
MSEPQSSDAQPRRSFVKEAAALAIGGAVTAVPIATGVFVWLDPLRRSGGAGGRDFIRITALEALPTNGVPQKFTVLADRTDAWTRTPQVPVGAIYLARTGDRTVKALQCICPHAGCFLEYRSGKHEFFCPCHNSTFAADGSINDPKSPSARPMDELAVELRGNEVWVQFMNFEAGHKDKRPIA